MAPENAPNKPDLKPEAPAAAPAVAPSAPVAAPENAPKEPAPVAVQGEKTAKDLTVPTPVEKPASPAESKDKPAGQEEDLPDNEWSRAYYDLKEQIKNNPQMNGPMVAFGLAMLKMLAKYSDFADIMPGSFKKRVTESAEMKAKVLPKEKAELIVKGEGKGEQGAAKHMVEVIAKEKAGGRKYGMERASTKFACNALWNIDDIDDSATLAAYLLNTSKSTDKGAVPLYKESTFALIKAQDPITKGTILIFKPSVLSGEKVVAYATGTKDQFQYFDAKDGDVKSFDLNGEKSLVKSEASLHMILEPNTQAYAAAKENGETSAVPEAEKVADVKKIVEKAADKVEKDNADVANLISEYEKNPMPANFSVLKTEVVKISEAVQKAHDEMKAKYESLKPEEKIEVTAYFDKIVAALEVAKVNAAKIDELEKKTKSA